MTQVISFTINGTGQTLEIEQDTMFVDLIRDQLNLTGTKRGCDNATCGSCVIIMDGRAIKSCNTPAVKAEGATIFTVEGLSKGMSLHPVQKALIESGAIQCGFCTPGIVLELVALFDAKPGASEGEIMNALNKHLCRCTGYEPILNGALEAQKLISP
ncbi:MAG: (2Fe-2S)-binding protein [Anaerolineaceae bacterium]